MKKLLLLTVFASINMVVYSQKPGPDTVYYKCEIDTGNNFARNFCNIEIGQLNWPAESWDSIGSINYKFTIQYQIDTLCNILNVKVRKPSKHHLAEKILLREFKECIHIEFLNGVQNYGCPITAKTQPLREIDIKLYY
ncbi:MAG TPA: hypothetical protein VEC12_00545 [Bacteroidia bacterium]|nr:hypothetical protein [Bacteroidia bacterium]